MFLSTNCDLPQMLPTSSAPPSPSFRRESFLPTLRRSLTAPFLRFTLLESPLSRMYAQAYIVHAYAWFFSFFATETRGGGFTRNLHGSKIDSHGMQQHEERPEGILREEIVARKRKTPTENFEIIYSLLSGPCVMGDAITKRRPSVFGKNEKEASWVDSLFRPNLAL